MMPCDLELGSRNKRAPTLFLMVVDGPERMLIQKLKSLSAAAKLLHERNETGDDQ